MQFFRVIQISGILYLIRIGLISILPFTDIRFHFRLNCIYEHIAQFNILFLKPVSKKPALHLR